VDDAEVEVALGLVAAGGQQRLAVRQCRGHQARLADAGGAIDHDGARIPRPRRRQGRPQARQFGVAPDDPARCPAAFTHPCLRRADMSPPVSR
jgi:hypothetical protein